MHFIGQSVLLQMLGWALLNSLWQMALLWALYLLITGMNKRFTASARHNIALFLSSAGSAWFVYTLLSGVPVGGSADRFPAIGLAAENNFSRAVLALKQEVSAALPYLSFVYLGILMVLSVRYFRNYLHLRQIRTAGLHKIHPRLRVFTNTVAQHIGIKKSVKVWLSSVVESPMTIGFFKPVILVPVATINHLTMEQAETILLHELTHIRRNDYLVNLYITVTGILFFFNPFARLFIHAIKKEREYCCDDLVMQFQYNAHTYASALLSLERTRNRRQQLALAAIGRNDQLLLERVKRVTGHRAGASRYSVAALCCFFLALLAGLGSLVRPGSLRIKKIPVAIETAAPVAYSSDKELRQKEFSTVAAPVKEKLKKLKLKIIKYNPANDNAREDFTLSFIPVVNNTSDNEKTADNIIAAPNRKQIDYSMPVPNTTATAPVEVAPAYPYVPQYSFSYRITDDSALNALTANNNYFVITNPAIQKALNALNDANWSEVEKELNNSNSTVSAQLLNSKIRSALAQAERVAKKKNMTLIISDADAPGVLENVQVQIKTLESIRATQQSLLNISNSAQEHRIQSRDLKQQFKSLQEVQQELKKKIRKIIYI